MTGDPILELGVGTGRVAVPIAKDGHTVVGVDRSPSMLRRAGERARRAGTELRLVEADMRTFSLDLSFRLIAIAFNTFLMLRPEDRERCLERAREHLAQGGVLAIDVFQPDPEVIVGVDGGVREEWTRRDPDTGRDVTKFSSTRADVDQATFRWWFEQIDDDGRVRRWQSQTTVHYLYRREAELLMRIAGFEIDTFHGNYDGSPARASSPRLLIVARRRERGSGRERRV